MAAKNPTPPTFKVTSDGSFTQNHLKRLREQRAKNEFIDFHMKSGEKSIPAHKIIISYSPVLRAMLTSELSGPQKNEASFDDFEPNMLENIVEYMYSGELEIAYDGVKDVFVICDYFQLDELKEKCAAYVLGQMNVNNCVGWYVFAEKYNVKAVKKEALGLISSRLREVQEQQEFKELLLSNVLGLVKQDELQNIKQGAVLEACLCWVKYKEKERLEHVPDMVNRVKLEDLPVRGLKHIINDYQHLIEKHPEVQIKVMDTFVKLSELYDEMCMLGGIKLYVGGDNHQKIYSRDMTEPDCQLTEKCTIPEWDVFHYSGMGATKNDILIIGGQASGNYTNRCKKYNVSSNTWTELTKMSTARQRPVCVTLNDKVYVIGGHNGSYVKVVECMEVSTMHWQKLPDIPQPGYYTATVINNSIFCFEYISNYSCHKFDTETNSWSTINKPADIDTRHVTSVAAGGRVYLLGGNSNICVCYNPNTDTFSKLSQPKCKHIYPCAVHYENKLYLLGGDCNDVEIYDLDQYHWYHWTLSTWKLPETMCLHHAFLLEE